jgi:hypothetical protein
VKIRLSFRRVSAVRSPLVVDFKGERTSGPTGN